MSSVNKSFSLVVPVFNEEETLAYSHKRLLESLNTQPFTAFDFVELIYVNDGSRDGSAEILQKIVATTSQKIRIKCVHFARNFGHSNAVLAGLENTEGDLIGIIDADLQDPPELLAPMVREIENGYDVVYGQRLKREKESIFKRCTAWFFYRLLNSLTGLPIPKDTGDFRIITREVLESLLQCGEPEPFLRGLVAWVGYKQKAFGYVRQSRQFGTTKYPFKKMFKFALNALLNFSITPLRFAIYLGFFVFITCLLLISWALWVHFQGHTVPGWTSILIAFLLGQSMTLFVLGVIGLYVGQIHIGVQGRPRYLVRKSASLINQKSKGDEL